MSMAEVACETRPELTQNLTQALSDGGSTSFSKYYRALTDRGSMEWEFIHWMYYAGKWDLAKRNAELDSYYKKKGW